MPDSFRDRLETEAGEWVDADIISPDQANAILARYPEDTEPGDGDWTTALLYGTAAVLVGAAALALVFVGIDPANKAPYLLGLGLGLATLGLGLLFVDTGRELLADVLLGASLAPLAAAPFASEAAAVPLLYGLVGLGIPWAYLLWRREQPFLPTLSVIGVSVASAGTAFEILEPTVGDDGMTVIWLVLQAILLVGLVAIDRLLREEDATTPVALATLVLAGSLIPFLLESVNIDDSEMVELVLGGAMMGVLLAGVPLKHRGLVVGASVAIGVDAIVFAFDVGGVFFGTLLLVGLAIGLIVQAEAVKRWVQAAT